ncbi:hypothetical protein ES703_06643 [subsurface metagenome]
MTSLTTIMMNIMATRMVITHSKTCAGMIRTPSNANYTTNIGGVKEIYGQNRDN